MLTRIPLQDNYDTTLSQQLLSSETTGGYIYVTTVPTFTFPTGFTTSVKINPGTTLQEEIEIDQIDSVNKRLRILTRALDLGAGISGTAQTHSQGSSIIISDSYAFWDKIQDALNNFDGKFRIFVDDTARDAAITSPEEGQVCISASVFQIYTSSAWASPFAGMNYAKTRVIAPGSADNGEIYRNSSDSNNVYYKNTAGTSIALWQDVSANKTSIVDADRVLIRDSANNELITPVTWANTKAQIRTDMPGNTSQTGFVELGTDAELLTGSSTSLVPNISQVSLNTDLGSAYYGSYPYGVLVGFEGTQVTPGGVEHKKFTVTVGGTYCYAATLLGAGLGSASFRKNGVEYSNDGLSGTRNTAAYTTAVAGDVLGIIVNGGYLNASALLYCRCNSKYAASFSET